MIFDPSSRNGALDEEIREHGPKEGLGRGDTSFDVVSSGDWIPSEDLHRVALRALDSGGDVAVNLGGVDHLDASVLQILLALDLEQKHRSHNLQLAKASPDLRRWFELAGVAGQFFMTEGMGNE